MEKVGKLTDKEKELLEKIIHIVLWGDVHEVQLSYISDLIYVDGINHGHNIDGDFQDEESDTRVHIAAAIRKIISEG